MVEASCFQARRVGAEGMVAGLAVGTSRPEAVAIAAAVVTEGAGGEDGANEGLVSVAVFGKEASVFPFTAPPASVRKWKLQMEKGLLR